MKVNPREYQLAMEIEDARSRREYELVKALTQELIQIQKQYPEPGTPSDDELVRKHGVRRKHLEKERELSEKIGQAVSDGDTGRERELRDKLIAVQKEQPDDVGPKFR